MSSSSRNFQASANSISRSSRASTVSSKEEKMDRESGYESYQDSVKAGRSNESQVRNSQSDDPGNSAPNDFCFSAAPIEATEK